MTVDHFGHSVLPTRIAIGPPCVRPCRTPPVRVTSSCSKDIRAPRPCPSRRRASWVSMSEVCTSTPGGQTLEDRGELLAVGLTCGQPAQHAGDSASRGPPPAAPARGAAEGANADGASARARTAPARSGGPNGTRRPPARAAGGQQRERHQRAGQQAEEDAGEQDAPAGPAQQEPEQAEQLHVAEAQTRRGDRGRPGGQGEGDRRGGDGPHERAPAAEHGGVDEQGRRADRVGRSR